MCVALWYKNYVPQKKAMVRPVLTANIYKYKM